MSISNQRKFTKPSISTSGKDWYVWFRYYDEASQKMKLIIRKGGVNYQDISQKERLAQLNALRDAIAFKLEQQDWNPITNTYPKKTPKELEFEKLQSMGFNEALTFALSKCVVAKKTKSGYKGTVDFFQLAAEQLGIDQTKIVEVRRQHIKVLLEHICKDRKWSNHAHNKHLGYLGSVLERLLDWEIIDINPAHKIKILPVAETEKYQPLTTQEREKVVEFLFINHYRYFVFLMVIFHTGIRPKEILALRISDISKDLTDIKIVPDLEEENSKTKKIRRVPINQHLQILLRELKLQEYPADYYVFGSPFEPGIGNRGSTKNGRGAFHPDYFKPSKTQIKRDTVTKLWKKIRETLGIDKYQYAFKHTGADAKIMAGMDLDALRQLYGHSSKFMTEKYARQVKDLYRKQIIENSPSFS
jgi:integrase